MADPLPLTDLNLFSIDGVANTSLSTPERKVLKRVNLEQMG
jgi:hypothetical protein